MKSNTPTIHKKNITVGIAGLLLFLFAYTVVAYFHPIQSTDLKNAALRLTATRLFFWGLLVALGIYCRKVEHTTICAVEQRTYPWYFYLLASIVVLFVIMLGSGILMELAKLISKNQTSTNYVSMKQVFLHYPALAVFTAITAGITEEYFFRGYLQSRLTILFNKNIGIVVSALLFGLLHYNYGTLIQVLFPFYLGLVFSLFYDKYRNIRFLMALHFVWDAVALYNLTHFKIPLH